MRIKIKLRKNDVDAGEICIDHENLGDIDDQQFVYEIDFFLVYDYRAHS
jgi:hypothetical protein